MFAVGTDGQRGDGGGFDIFVRAGIVIGEVTLKPAITGNQHLEAVVGLAAAAIDGPAAGDFRAGACGRWSSDVNGNCGGGDTTAPVTDLKYETVRTGIACC